MKSHFILHQTTVRESCRHCHSSMTCYCLRYEPPIHTVHWILWHSSLGDLGGCQDSITRRVACHTQAHFLHSQTGVMSAIYQFSTCAINQTHKIKPTAIWEVSCDCVIFTDCRCWSDLSHTVNCRGWKDCK